MAEPDTTLLTLCMLAGGEGRRMGGQDKGLLSHQGQTLTDLVLQRTAGQAGRLMVSANRNLPSYEKRLRFWAEQAGAINDGVWRDDPDLAQRSGPLAGIITALRHCQTPWLMIVPCDTPALPEDLIQRLYTQAKSSSADIVVPRTHANGQEERCHWVCALIRKGVCPHTEALFAKGERKAGQWVQSCRWSSVSFDDDAAFTNMNTPETLHGRA